MKKINIIVSRASVNNILKEDKLIPSLQNKNNIFIYSIRSANKLKIFKINYEELHFIELRNCEDYLYKLVTLIQARYLIENIIYISEQDLLPVAYIRDKLNLSGLKYEQALQFRDKPTMKNIINKTSIYVPKFINCLDFYNLKIFCEKYKKIIVKPRDGYGSQQTFIINSPEDLNYFYSQIDHANYIAEEFIDKDVYHLDAIVRYGNIIFATLGKYNIPVLNFSNVPILYSIITNEETPLFISAKNALNKILKTMQVQDGVFHFEFFSSGTITQEIIFCEIAIRPAGGGIIEAIYNTWGISLYEEHINIQLGINSTNLKNELINKIQYTTSVLFINKKEGIIKEYEGINEILNMGCKIIYNYNIGDKIAASRYSADAILTVIANDKNEIKLKNKIKFIQNNLKIQIK